MITGRHDPHHHPPHVTPSSWCLEFSRRDIRSVLRVLPATRRTPGVGWLRNPSRYRYILEIHAQHLSTIYHTSGRDLYSSSIHQFHWVLGYGADSHSSGAIRCGDVNHQNPPKMNRSDHIQSNQLSQCFSFFLNPQTLSQNKITAK